MPRSGWTAGRVISVVLGSLLAITGTGAGGVVSHGGTVRPAPPRTAGIWVAQVAGTGTQTLRWTVER